MPRRKQNLPALTSEQILKIIEYANIGVPLSRIANNFGLSIYYVKKVSNIFKDKTPEQIEELKKQLHEENTKPIPRKKQPYNREYYHSHKEQFRNYRRKYISRNLQIDM